MIEKLEFLKNTTWQDVFATWKSHEGTDPVWQDFAVREKGWGSWDEWRSYQSGLVGLPDRDWKLYKIENIYDVVPNFLMGPFRGWQQHFEEKNVHSFADLIQTNREWVEDNVGVKSCLEQMPDKVEFIGIYIEEDDTIVLFEGHHRCAGITLAGGHGIELKTSATIALTTMNRDEKRDILDALLDKPSDNPQKTS